MNLDLEKIYLYHGSNTVVSKPLLSKCKNGKDFGKGFYLTTDKEQAIKFAKIISKRDGGDPILNVYNITSLFDLKIKCFDDTSKEWLQFVISNRDNRLKKTKYEYDIYIGKIADDDTAKVISAYTSGAYGKPELEEAISIAIKMFRPEKLKDQITFVTDKSINRVNYINSEVVKND